jgi:hypothetical protein
MATAKKKNFLSTIDYSKQHVALTAAAGALVGSLTWVLSLFLQRALIEPVFCRSADAFTACANGGTTSIVLSLIAMNIIGLVILNRLGIYRPLLVILAALATLAGVNGWLGGLSWYEASLWYGLVFAAAYALYTWIARLTSFTSALIAMMVVIIIFRVFAAHI